MVLFGGTPTSGSNLLPETWEWDGSSAGSWSQRATTGPARKDPAMAYDAARGRTILFGGRIGTTTQNDTWAWDGAAWTQLFPANSPPPRYSAGMVYDAARSVIVLGAGLSGSATYTDTWEWDGSDWALRSAALPGLGGPAAYDAVRQRVVGYQSVSPGWTLVEWDGSNWNPRPTTNLSQVSGFLIFDPRLSTLTAVGYSSSGGTA